MENKRMLRCGYQSLFYVLFAWILAACGGGGGGGVDPNAGNISSGNSSLNTMTLSLVDNGGTATTSISNASPGILAATIADSSGNPVAGQVVTFSLDGTIGSLNPSSGTALTNSSGVATISLNAGTTAGAGTVTARAPFTIAQNTSFTSAGDAPSDQQNDSSSVGTTLTLAITKSSDGTAYTFPTEMVTQNDPAILTATLSDASGPISGRAVSFSTTAGAVSISNTLTNVAGQASVTLSAGSIRTAGTATATFGGISAQVDFETAGDDQAASTDPTIISVTLTDQSGNPLNANTITETTSGRINVTLTRGGAPRANRLVTVTATNGLLDPRDANGAASTITDSNGQANVTLLAGGLSGAGEISVAADGATSNSVIAFQIQSADIQIGDNSPSSGTFSQGTLEVGATTLDSGNTTTVSAYLVDANNGNAVYTTPTAISFSSNCATSGDAVIDASQITDSTTGIATAAYVSKGTTGSCSGTDLITATANIGGSAITAQTSININAAPGASIAQEGDANPTVIALQNTSGLGRPTSSTITFKVLDSNGFAASGIDVNFSLSTTLGGITLTPSSATSLSDGTVQVQVNAGTVPTPVRVRAAFTQSGSEIATLSEQLSISTGIPDQNSFDVSLSQLSVLGYDTNGVEVTVSAQAADHFNNPAPNGTTFSFVSELGGSVDPQCSVTNNQGSCSVTFRTGGTRPTADQTADVSNGFNDRFGRTTILSYAIGEESYGDSNGNNYYDTGELVAQLPEAFIDINENGTRDASITPATTESEWSTITFEEFTDFDVDGTYDNADTTYNGTLCSAAASTTHCQALINVRDSATLILSTRNLIFYVFAGGVDTTGLEFIESGTHAVPTPPSTPKNTVITGVSSTFATGAGTAYTVAANSFNPTFSTVTNVDLLNFSGATVTIVVTDLNGNPPANGTQFNFSCSECSVPVASHTVVNETHFEAISVSIEQKDNSEKNGNFSVTVTHPDSIQSGGGTLFGVRTQP